MVDYMNERTNERVQDALDEMGARKQTIGEASCSVASRREDESFNLNGS